MPDWLLTALISSVGVIGALFVAKYRIGENEKKVISVDDRLTEYIKAKKIEDEKNRLYLDKQVTQLWERLDATTNTVAEHKIKIANSPTMSEVEKKFVLREVYDLIKVHNNEKFSDIKSSIKEFKKMVELTQGSPP